MPDIKTVPAGRTVGYFAIMASPRRGDRDYLGAYILPHTIDELKGALTVEVFGGDTMWVFRYPRDGRRVTTNLELGPGFAVIGDGGKIPDWHQFSLNGAPREPGEPPEWVLDKFAVAPPPPGEEKAESQASDWNARDDVDDLIDRVGIKLNGQARVEARQAVLRALSRRIWDVGAETLVPPGLGKTKWANVGEIVQAILDGGLRPERPGVLTFTDDPERAVFYIGRLNVVFGPGGVGKSHLIAHLQAWFINHGMHVVHLEFDNNTTEQVIARLLLAGAEPGQVQRFFHVPESPSLQMEPLELDDEAVPSLVTIDSVNAAISMLGVDANSSSRAMDTFVSRLVEPYTRVGATAVAIDHSGLSDVDRPSNNIRKQQAVQGTLVQVERHGAAGCAGTRWMSRLILRKDNPGGVGVAVGDTLGVVVFDGRPENGMDLVGSCAVSLWAKTPALDALAEAHGRRESEDEQRMSVRVLRVVDRITGDDGAATHEVWLAVKEEMHFEGTDEAERKAKANVRMHLQRLREKRLVYGYHRTRSPKSEVLYRARREGDDELEAEERAEREAAAQPRPGPRPRGLR